MHHSGQQRYLLLSLHADVGVQHLAPFFLLVLDLMSGLWLETSLLKVGELVLLALVVLFDGFIVFKLVKELLEVGDLH